jgi:hypothetical protein
LEKLENSETEGNSVETGPESVNEFLVAIRLMTGLTMGYQSTASEGTPAPSGSRGTSGSRHSIRMPALAPHRLPGAFVGSGRPDVTFPCGRAL